MGDKRRMSGMRATGGGGGSGSIDDGIARAVLCRDKLHYVVVLSVNVAAHQAALF